MDTQRLNISDNLIGIKMPYSVGASIFKCEGCQTTQKVKRAKGEYQLDNVYLRKEQISGSLN